MIVGTVLIITSETSITPDSITISIYDPDQTIVVTAQTMADDGDNSYSYIYQNAVGSTAGRYTVIISAVNGAYTARSKKTFDLELKLD